MLLWSLYGWWTETQAWVTCSDPCTCSLGWRASLVLLLVGRVSMVPCPLFMISVGTYWQPPPCATLLPGRWECRDGLKELASQTGALVLPHGTHHDRPSAQEARQLHVAVWLGECLDTRVLMSRFDMSWVQCPCQRVKTTCNRCSWTWLYPWLLPLLKGFSTFYSSISIACHSFFPWKVLLLWSEE